MDWGTKLPAWDLSELDHLPEGPEPNIGSMVAASSSGNLRGQTSGLDFDLKLGGLGDLGSTSKWKEQVRSSATLAVPPSGTSKRARTPSNGSQNVSCLVDGCQSDLSSCREYHRRHKVCEAHSKTPIVLVGGQEQRFCQQCSRFHLLMEFDEVKRSCRKRLDGHNRRRRKPQPEPMNTGSFHLNFQGPRFSLYSHLYPTSTTDPPATWNTAVKNEEEMHGLHPPRLVDRQLHFSDLYSHRRGDAKQQRFPFGLQDDDNNGTTISSRTPETSTVSFSRSSNNNSTLSRVLDSDCALSLLSSPACMASISSHMVTVDRIPVAQTLTQGLQHQGGCLGRYSPSQSNNNNVISTTGFSCTGMDGEQVSGTILVPHDAPAAATDSHLQCPGIFHAGGGGSSNNGSSGILPFSW